MNTDLVLLPFALPLAASAGDGVPTMRTRALPAILNALLLGIGPAPRLAAARRTARAMPRPAAAG